MIEYRYHIGVCKIYVFPLEADNFFKIKYHVKIAYRKKTAIHVHTSQKIKHSLFVTNV